MQAYKFSAVMAAVVAAAIVAFTAGPSEAQTTTAQARQGSIRVATAGRPPARVTVRKRSYLDPGKESKAPGLTWSSFPADSPQGLFYDPTANYLHFNNRNPFPNCLDLPGFCR